MRGTRCFILTTTNLAKVEQPLQMRDVDCWRIVTAVLIRSQVVADDIELFCQDPICTVVTFVRAAVVIIIILIVKFAAL